MLQIESFPRWLPPAVRCSGNMQLLSLPWERPMPSQLPALKLSTAPLSSLPCCFHLLNTDQIIFLHPHHWCCFNLSLFNSSQFLVLFLYKTRGASSTSSHLRGGVPLLEDSKEDDSMCRQEQHPGYHPTPGFAVLGLPRKTWTTLWEGTARPASDVTAGPPLPTALTCSPSDGLARPSHGQGRGHMMLEQHKEHQAQNRDTPES